MKRLMLVALVGCLALLPAEAGAGGPGTGLPPVCQVTNPGNGAIALRGVVAVEAQSSLAGVTEVDFTFRLVRGGATQFFRVTVSANIFGFSNEEVLCLALSDAGLVTEVLDGFSLPRTRSLVFTDKSISNADGPGPNQVLPSGRGTNLADVVIYAQ